MTVELPDFTTAPAWQSDEYGVVFSREYVVRSAERGADWVTDLGPWTPLDTAEGWVKRIDPAKLAAAMCFPTSHLPSAIPEPCDECEHQAHAAIAALPELMGGAR